MVGQAVVRRQLPQREVPQLDTRTLETKTLDVQKADVEEGDVQGEVSCFKEVGPNGNTLQRDVTVRMGDTPSPAPSVISILTDGEDDREEDDTQRCRVSE